MCVCVWGGGGVKVETEVKLKVPVIFSVQLNLFFVVYAIEPNQLQISHEFACLEQT